jgi:uncharacterized membrane protein
MRDRLRRELHETEKAFNVGAADLRQRARGLAAEASARLNHEPVDDDVLSARVRSRIGRLVSHPGLLGVTARSGRLTLDGPILADEVEALLAAVGRVRGVASVDNRLEVHREADAPALQGGVHRAGRYSFYQMEGSPAAWLLGAGGGGGLWLLGSLRRGAIGRVLRLIGGGLVARSLLQLPTRRAGEAARHRWTEVQKTVHVHAPIEEVFRIFRRFENLPHFMSRIRSVHTVGAGRTRWRAEGPGGLKLEWDTEVTELVENRAIAWRSLPGAAVENGGRVRLEAEGPGETRLDLSIHYRPPGGLFGRALSAIFGMDPKRVLDQDLVRFKSLLEQGKTRVHGEPVTREQIDREMGSASTVH